MQREEGATPSDADALARELRAITAALAEHDLGQANLSEATDLARKLRQTLEGPRRARWYDADVDALSLSPESRTAYLDQSPIRGRLNPVAPPLSIRVTSGSDGKQRIEGRAHLGIAYEGPPHGVHGGWVAALFDDVLGATQGLSGGGAVTAKLTVRYRAVTPIDEDLRLEGWIDRETQRRIVARARCYAGDTLTADAEGIFVRVDFNEIQAYMRERKSDGQKSTD